MNPSLRRKDFVLRSLWIRNLKLKFRKCYILHISPNHYYRPCYLFPQKTLTVNIQHKIHFVRIPPAQFNSIMKVVRSTISRVKSMLLPREERKHSSAKKIWKFDKIFTPQNIFMMFSETFPIPLCGWNVSSMVEDTGASDKEIVFVLILEQKVSFF